jgi:subtilisin family serine protease
MRVALTFSLLVLAVLAPAAQAAASGTRIIVRRDPGLTGAERADVRSDAGVELDHTLRIPNTEVVTTDHPQASLAVLRKDPDVRYAEIDHVRHAVAADPDFHFQWALDNTGTNLSDTYILPDGVPDADMDVPDAWLQSTGTGVTVAVVDTIVQADHPDLAAAVTSSGNFVTMEADTSDPDYEDERDHGTHVAGIVAAQRDNGVGIKGIAPDARIMALRGLDDGGGGWDSDIATAFQWAADHGARVVNASLGGPDEGTLLAKTILANKDTLFVVAAGNEGADNGVVPEWPCNIDAANVICVGASTDRDVPASYSNYSPVHVDLFAPGGLIMSTVRGGGTDLMSGTSMASPAVAAEAALVLAAAPSLTPTQVKATILAGADPKASFAGLSVSGRRANAQGAVALAAAHSIPVDVDDDGVPDTLDNRIDSDSDGVLDSADACPAVAAATANGCPAPAATPAPAPALGGTPYTPAAPTDADGDGRPDASDLCPTEAAATTTGCPVPGLTGLSVKVSHKRHRATVKVRSTRAATVALKVERRVCNSAGRKCRWRKAASLSRSTRGNAATFSVRKLARGRYRVAVRLSSPAGKTQLAHKSFKF